MLKVPPTATGASPGIAEWIRKAATAINGGFVPVPATATSPGQPGQIAFESGFLYVCVATDTWERVALASWP